MVNTVFAEIRFWLLVVFSTVLPFSIYGVLFVKRAISRVTVAVLGFTLVFVSGVDVYLLQSIASLAKLTPSLADDAVFLSELSLALYLFPVVFGGIGVNLVSHVLARHLTEAERHFEENRARSA